MYISGPPQKNIKIKFKMKNDGFQRFSEKIPISFLVNLFATLRMYKVSVGSEWFQIFVMLSEMIDFFLQ